MKLNILVLYTIFFSFSSSLFAQDISQQPIKVEKKSEFVTVVRSINELAKSLDNNAKNTKVSVDAISFHITILSILATLIMFGMGLFQWFMEKNRSDYLKLLIKTHEDDRKKLHEQIDFLKEESKQYTKHFFDERIGKEGEIAREIVKRISDNQQVNNGDILYHLEQTITQLWEALVREHLPGKVTIKKLIEAINRHSKNKVALYQLLSTDQKIVYTGLYTLVEQKYLHSSALVKLLRTLGKNNQLTDVECWVAANKIAKSVGESLE